MHFLSLFIRLCCLHTCCFNECSNRIINLSPSIYFNKNFIPVWCKEKLHLKWYAFLVSMARCKDTTAEKAHSLYMPNIPHYANHLIRSSIKFQQWNWFHTYIKAPQSQSSNVLPSMKIEQNVKWNTAIYLSSRVSRYCMRDFIEGVFFSSLTQCNDRQLRKTGRLGVIIQAVICNNRNETWVNKNIAFDV